MWGNVGVEFGGQAVVVVVLWPFSDAKTAVLGGVPLPGGGGVDGGGETSPISIRAHG